MFRFYKIPSILFADILIGQCVENILKFWVTHFCGTTFKMSMYLYSLNFYRMQWTLWRNYVLAFHQSWRDFKTFMPGLYTWFQYFRYKFFKKTFSYKCSIILLYWNEFWFWFAFNNKHTIDDIKLWIAPIVTVLFWNHFKQKVYECR